MSLSRLRHLLLPTALCAPVAWITHPAALILLMLAMPLFLAAVAAWFTDSRALPVAPSAIAPSSDWASRVSRGALPSLMAILVLGTMVAALVGWPALALARAPDAASAMWFSIGVAVLLVLLSRLWPVLGLPWLAVHDDASAPSSLARLALGVSAAWRMTRGFFYTLGSGLVTGSAWTLVMVGAFALVGLFGALPQELRILMLGIWTLLIVPLACVIALWRCARLLREHAAQAPYAAASLQVSVGPIATFLPSTPDAATDESERSVFALGHDVGPFKGGEVVVNNVPDAEPGNPAGGALDRGIDPYPAVDPAALSAGLLSAAAAGDVPRALDLLRQGADPAAMPALDARDQRSLAMIAATLPDLRLLREVIARGGDINRAIGGLTPLLAATRDSLQGRADAVMTLLTNGADPRVTDAQGTTALHHAARCTDPAVAAMLLDAGAERDALNGEGHSPLAIAALSHNDAVLACLLDRGARVEPVRGLPVLIAAMSGAEDRPASIKLLMKHKARLDARDVLGRSALHAAALHGHGDSVNALLTAGADVNARDQAGVTPLMEAARAGHDAVLERIAQRKPVPNDVDAVGRTALVIACQSRRATPDTVRILLEAGVDPALASRDGKRAVEFAVNAGRWREVALLDPNYPLPASVRAHDDDADDEATDGVAHVPPDRAAMLGQALARRHFASADELLALKPTLDADALAEALVTASNRLDTQGYALLLRHGLRVDAVDTNGKALLHRIAAARPLPLNTLRLLRTGGASPAGGAALAALLEGALSGDAAMRPRAQRLALEWLGAGADATRKLNAASDSPLRLAVRLGATSLVRELLARGAPGCGTDARGRSLLHLLAGIEDEGCAIAVARELLRAGCDPAARDTQGQTPQGAALARGRGALAHWLGWSPWLPPGRPLRDSDLPAAAALGDRAAVTRLLDLGLALDARDVQGCTALIRAAGGGFADLATLLLARGADAEARASSGITALGAALNAGRIALVDRLLDHGIAVDQRLVDEATPLMLAAALGRSDGVARLLAHRADVHARDAQGNTALHAAAQFAYTDAEPERARALLAQLLDAGAEIDARNTLGQTPLLVLLGARVTVQTPPGSRALVDLAGMLVATGASLDVQDTRGVGVLHAAAMHGLLDAARWLIRAGADARLRDTLGRTAHDVALVLGFVDVAAELKR